MSPSTINPQPSTVPRYRGTVVSFNRARGYGFIKPLQGQGLIDKDVFAHITGIVGAGPRELNPGDQVSFELRPGNSKGPQAANVRVQLRSESPSTLNPQPSTS